MNLLDLMLLLCLWGPIWSLLWGLHRCYIDNNPLVVLILVGFYVNVSYFDLSKGSSYKVRGQSVRDNVLHLAFCGRWAMAQLVALL